MDGGVHHPEVPQDMAAYPSIWEWCRQLDPASVSPQKPPVDEPYLKFLGPWAAAFENQGICEGHPSLRPFPSSETSFPDFLTEQYSS